MSSLLPPKKLCWECKAELTKMERFKQRAIWAQASIVEFITGNKSWTDLKSLSSLSVSPLSRPYKIICDIKSFTEKPLVLKNVAKLKQPPHQNVAVFSHIDKTPEPKPVEQNSFVVVKIEEDDQLPTEDLKFIGYQLTPDRIEDPKPKESLVIKPKNTIDFEHQINFHTVMKNQDKPRQQTNLDKTNKETKKIIGILKTTAKTIVAFDQQINVHPVSKNQDEVTQQTNQDKSLRNYNELIMQRTKEHLIPETFQCKKCPKVFKNCANYLRHLRIHDKNRPVFQCPKCPKKYKHKFTLRHHLNTHDQNFFICTICDIAYKSNTVLENHMRMKHLLKKNYNEFIMHRTKEQHRILETFQCKKCAKVFKNRCNYSQHIKIHDKNRPVFQCPKCKNNEFEFEFLQKYKNNFSLRDHLNTHDQLLMFICTICDIAYKTKPVLNHHMRMKHSLNKHECTYCGASFAVRYMLVHHLDAVHSPAPKYRCELCDKMFKTTVLLRRHVLTVHEDKPKKICDYCGKAFDVSFRNKTEKL